MVEVSVVLAEALLLEREGTALRKRQRQQQLRAGGAGATEAALDSEGADVASRCWDDEREAENRRRVDVLSRSLEASDVQDLQVLRRSLQRQLEHAARGGGAKVTRGVSSRGERTSPGRSPAPETEGPGVDRDEDEAYRADVLAQRLEVVERAVERKGGWRAAVFLGDNKKGSSGGGGGGGSYSSGQVNVDVDVEAWPAADAVQMLQTVKDALNVQLLEVRDRVVFLAVLG